MLAIYRREMQGYFYTPIAYVFMGVFLSLSAVFFGAGNLAERSANMMILLRNISYLWMLLSPVLTMKLISGEKGRHTDKLLFSCPIPVFSVISGKFAAAFTVMLLTVVLTFVFPILIACYGKLYLPETITGYLGLILQGGCFIALDMFVTCFTRSQITAVIACFGVNLIVWLFDAVSAAVHGTLLADILSFFSLYQRLTPFVMGQFSMANIIFALLFTFFMLFMCVRMMDARRWSEV